MEQLIKLTLRIPSRLHNALRQRAYQDGISLNSVIVTTLESGLEKGQLAYESEREYAIRVLLEKKLLSQETSLLDVLEPVLYSPGEKVPQALDEPKLTHAELRQLLKDVPPLSDLIIEDREPR